MGFHVNIGEAKNRLSELIAASLRGEEVILSKAGRPVARILALDEAVIDAKAQRVAKWDIWIGSKKGSVDPEVDWFAPDYTDAELDSFSKFPGD